ncbi:MAG: GSCFA domain-containing protein, partial [Cyclobacteriaceae bacterium]|nr:GSCFA domain-containing protein [Cyclobacteriaceae bacterium]
LVSNYHFHSSFSHQNYDILKNNVTSALTSTRIFLESCDYLLITLGTAWVYKEKKADEIVSNCHKMPANHFSKKLLSLEEITEPLKKLLDQIFQFRQEIKIIFTLSPVRHIKDSLEGNMVSKSLLRAAIHNLVENNKDLDYFPSYEIVIDDLRDYRFYEKDLLHPNEQAQQYIWQKFSDRYFDKNTRSILSEWEGIKKSLSHIPINKNSSHYLTFLNQTLERLIILNEKINVNQEITKIKEDLNGFKPSAIK